MSTIRKIGAAIVIVPLLGGCVPQYGAQVLLIRTQQSHDEVARRCKAGDQQACAVLPFASKALLQAQEELYPQWRLN